MARFEFSTPSGKSSYQITDEFVTIGSDAGNHLRLSDPAVAPVHLRLIHGQSGFRLELANPELKVRINGEECIARALKPNDRIEIGGSTLTFLDEQAAAAPPRQPVQEAPAPQPPRRPQATAPRQAQAAAPQQQRRAAPPAAKQQAAGHHAAGHHAGHHSVAHHHHRKEKDKRPPWVNWVIWCTVAFAALLLILWMLDAGSYYREHASPEHWLKVAQAELDKGEFNRALESCQMAMTREPDAVTQKNIEELRKKIEARRGRDKDQGALTSAKNSLEAMEQFEKNYLGAEQPRAAVRELARNAQQWLKLYSEVVARYPDTAGDVPKVQSLFNRWSPLAQLTQPDDANDVLFAVDRRLSLQRPLYREAIAAINGYLATRPNDKNGPKLIARRDEILKSARAEFDRREAQARQFLSSRRLDDARREVQAMRDLILDDAWAAQADAVDRAIQAAGQ
ncbi:MAG TPA: FHA domain-containing protein [Planctomycetota bacterium]